MAQYAGSRSRPTAKAAKPFLKWAGGKQQLLGQFQQHLPADFKRYFEPFLGGGAVFFHLWNTGRLPDEVFLFDNNEELINAFKVVRDRPQELIELLAIHKQKHNRDYYYEIRDLDRKRMRLNDVKRAARTIYLNKTCYNGLYRVNAKGQFNVPMGSYKNPRILYEDVLLAASAALQGAQIEVRDFRSVLELGRPGDLFYFDPPYHPLTATASFRSYTPDGFNDNDQRDLADLFTQLSEKGCLCMLSNSSTPFVKGLYSGFRIRTVNAVRAINCNGTGRSGIQEVVAVSY